MMIMSTVLVVEGSEKGTFETPLDKVERAFDTASAMSRKILMVESQKTRHQEPRDDREPSPQVVDMVDTVLCDHKRYYHHDDDHNDVHVHHNPWSGQSDISSVA